MDATSARAVIEVLVAERYIEEIPTNDEDEWFSLTILGGGLANARITRGVRRDKAKVHLDSFLTRVVEVNENREYLFAVQRVDLFGSFLDPTIDPVGDIDLAVSLVPKIANKQEHQEAAKRQVDEVQDEGRRFRSIVDLIGWPEQKVWLFLKSKSSVLSFTTGDDKVLDIADSTVLYERAAE